MSSIKFIDSEEYVRRPRGRPKTYLTEEALKQHHREYHWQYRQDHREHMNMLMREANKRQRDKRRAERSVLISSAQT
jgi:hypothetical protein